MAEASRVRGQNEVRITAASAVASGDVWQLKDGRAAVYRGTSAAASGDTNLLFRADDVYTVPKTANIRLLDGGRAYWDHSAGAVHYKKVNDRDFYLGRVVGDAGTDDTLCAVNFNVDPPYDLDLARDPMLSVVVGTAAAGGLSYPVRLGGCHILELDATNEAQKVDLLSVDGFGKNANAIIEGAFRILSDGSNATQDFRIGVANGTHASDADAITESIFVGTDGNSTNIVVESDDGTTEVAATDSMADYTEGSAVANRVEFWIDMRDPADVQFYINGVLVLPASVFNVDASTGPWCLLAHLEKSSSTDTYKVAVDWLRARFSEQNAS